MDKIAKMADKIAKEFTADSGDVEMVHYFNPQDLVKFADRAAPPEHWVPVRWAIEKAVDKVSDKYDLRMRGDIYKILQKDRKLISHLQEIGAEFTW